MRCSAMSLTATGDYVDRMNSIRKYVFSSTLEKADWTNTTIISGDPATAVSELKQHDGQPLVMYGHGPLGQTLLEHQLLDELHFMIHPVFVGGGTLLFREIDKTPLRLAGTKTPDTGSSSSPTNPRGADPRYPPSGSNARGVAAGDLLSLVAASQARASAK